MAEEWDIPETGSPSLDASYVYGLYVDEVLTMRRGGADYYYHADDMHNVVKLTDADGEVVEGYDYGDYGAPEFYDTRGNLESAPAFFLSLPNRGFIGPLPYGCDDIYKYIDWYHQPMA